MPLINKKKMLATVLLIAGAISIVILINNHLTSPFIMFRVPAQQIEIKNATYNTEKNSITVSLLLYQIGNQSDPNYHLYYTEYEQPIVISRAIVRFGDASNWHNQIYGHINPTALSLKEVTTITVTLDKALARGNYSVILQTQEDHILISAALKV